MRSSTALPVLLAALLPLACTESPADPIEPPFAAEVAAAPAGPTVPGVVGRVTGGGHLRNGPWHLSFAGVLEGAEGTEVETGRTTVVAQFHRASVPEVSGRTFKAHRLLGIRFVLPGDPLRCHAAVFANVEGTLDGEPGWVLRYRVSDGGPGKGTVDTVRFTLFEPGGLPVYDTTGGPGGDFPRESDCVGASRTNLSGGNLSIRVPTDGSRVN